MFVTARAQGLNQDDAFQRRVLPLIDRYCIDCHSEDGAEAGVTLDRFQTQPDAIEAGRLWLRVLDVLDSGTMPPASADQPSRVELDRVVGWIEEDFIAAQCGEVSAPSVVMRRLNRREYNNTLRDLVGLDLRLADDFPQDDIGFGYDNIGSALNISPIHIEKYLDAAEQALRAAIVLPDAAGFPPVELIGLRTYPLPRNEPVEFEHNLTPGRYMADLSLVRVGIADTVPPPRLVVGLGKDRRTVQAVGGQDETVVFRIWLKVSEGDGSVHVSLAPGEADGPNFVMPKGTEANTSGDQRYGSDRGLHVDSIVVRGPVVARPEQFPTTHRSILFRGPDADHSRVDAAREVLTRFVERAYRRPVTLQEVDRVLHIFQLADHRGESFERAAEVALTTVLVSPGFLFLVEPEEAESDRLLTEFELASRLSYFLWSSMPDEELLRDARRGTLRENLRRQVVRMLDDPKSAAFVRNFTGQWLQLRKLRDARPDAELFPGFDDQLRGAMREETERLFAHVVRDNRSVLELLDSEYTFMNERLARHYGVEGVSGAEFQRVALPSRRRGGVLTQASILTLTSNPNRTSPVKRGQWILQQLLGTPPPPPPPSVEPLDESKQASESASLRERLEIHRSNPDCAGCHNQMDPLGFALENYDAVGRWRTTDGDFAIDPSGELSGGRKFSDAQELKQVLKATSVKKFSRCFIENVLTYALGRSLVVQDFCTVEAVRDRLAGEEFRAQAVLFGIVESREFQHRGVTDD